MNKRKDYTVGRGKPPAEYRFKPGKSGNPSGRRKAAKTIVAMATEELLKPVYVTIDGRRKRMPFLQAQIAKLKQMALGGNLKANELLFSLYDHSLADSKHELDPKLLAALTSVELTDLYMEAIKGPA